MVPNKEMITIEEMKDGAASVGISLDEWDLHVLCNKCGHVQCVEPAVVTSEGRRIYGSRADFCDLCGSGKIGVREPDAVRNRLKEY